MGWDGMGWDGMGWDGMGSSQTQEQAKGLWLCLGYTAWR